jgi:hypothetical protein
VRPVRLRLNHKSQAANVGGQYDQERALLAASVLLPLAELPREKIAIVRRHPDTRSIGSGFNSCAIAKASSAKSQ